MKDANYLIGKAALGFDACQLSDINDIPNAKIFCVGEHGEEVAIACEWFSNDGEGWSFDATLIPSVVYGLKDEYGFSRDGDYQFSYKPDVNDFKEALQRGFGVKGVKNINEAIEFIKSQYERRPKMSAAEGYYGY